MTTQEAIKFYGTVAALAKALNVSVQAIYDWDEEPPALRQFQLERLSGGELKAANSAKDPHAA